MDEEKFWAEKFGAHRARLRAVAHRMLGSPAEADDAVQEVWLRLSRTGGSEIDNLGGWLTTVVARVCLDTLRARKARPEVPLDEEAGDEGAAPDEAPDAERELLLADSIGPALAVVLDALAPAERVAFVLHDLFGVSFEDIAAILGRTLAATRQLASRARRRIRGAEPPEAGRVRQREVVTAFLTAAREGDFQALLALLDPEVVLRADEAAIALRNRTPGAQGPAVTRTVRGANDVANTFSKRARAAQVALVDGAAAAVWVQHDTLRVVIRFTVEDGMIRAIELLADPAYLQALDLVILDARP